MSDDDEIPELLLEPEYDVGGISDSDDDPDPVPEHGITTENREDQ